MSLALGIADAASHLNDSSPAFPITHTPLHPFIFGHSALAPDTPHATLHPLKTGFTFPISTTPFVLINLPAPDLLDFDRNNF